MGFDYQNFGVGLLTGWATAYGVYRARNIFSNVATSASEQATTATRRARRGADRRYIDDLIARSQQDHLAGSVTDLSTLLVEPRFIRAPELPGLNDEASQNVFDVVPMVHDHSFLHAPYNLETLSISELALGHRAIALLGMPGSGRTTALRSIAMWVLGELSFRQPVDIVHRRIEEEESELSEADREIRLKQRASIEQRAKERLAQERGISFEQLEHEEDEATQIAMGFSGYMPVYIHLADVDLKQFGKEIDPAEPVVRAVQYRVGHVVGSTIPRNIYGRASRGQLLLLVDGYDELPERELEEKLEWLRAFISEYDGNFVVVAGPAVGYGPLTQAGLTPLFLRPWSDMDYAFALDNWTTAWSTIAGTRRRPAPAPDDTVLQRARINNRMLYPAEFTMKIWANFANDVDMSGIEGWLRSYIARIVTSQKGQSTDALLQQLAFAAQAQLDAGFVTEENLTALISGSSLPQPDPDLSELSEEMGEPEEGKKKRNKPKKSTDDDEDKVEATTLGKFLSGLEKDGLLVRHRGRRYRFSNSLIASYCASLTLKQASARDIAERALQPSWNQAIGYTALHTPIDEAIRARLKAPTDVLHNQVLQMARWLAYASNDATWRGPLLKHLSNMLTLPRQYPLVRERAAAALVDTRDKEALYIFRQAARNSNERVRQLACLGMGALGDQEAVKDLNPLLEDQDEKVQLAAGLGLAAIKTDEALEAMVYALTQGTEPVRQAIAEAFAAIPTEGYPVLYDAIQDNDMMLRRAAVFGLRRIRTTWAIIAIYQAFLEDEQWYVRSAAQHAFESLQQGADSGVVHYPPPQAVHWLTEWAAQNGESVTTPDIAEQMLVRALQEGAPGIRTMSAETMGQLGLVSTVKPLYRTLTDRDEAVRAAAYEALAEMQEKIGHPLPVPG